MALYGITWRCFWCVVTVLGVVSALLLWSTAEVVVTLVISSFVVGLTHHLLDPERDGRSGSRRPAWLASARLGIRTGPVGMALGGVAALSVSLMLLLVACAAASSPYVVSALRARARARRPAPASPPAVPVDEAVLAAVAHDVDEACVHSLSNAELCLAWRQSYASLQTVGSAAVHAAVVASRRAYLDEMERRDPDGLSAWLASGARAASGPERYLHDAEG